MDPNEHVLDLVDAYLHDVLPATKSQAVERHCEDCSICQAALDEARRRYDAVTALPPSEASEGLIQQTLQHVEQRLERRQRAWRLLFTARLNVFYA